MRPQRGFTLVELMIVVAMIAILAGIAVSQIDARSSPSDAGQVMAAMVRETSRKAVQLGTVREDVAATAGTEARSRLVIAMNGDRIRYTIQVMVEGSGSSGTWTELSVRELGPGPTIDGWTDRAILTDGGVAEHAMTTDPIELYCYPSGQCDAMTVYFAGTRATARTAVLPLGGAPVTSRAW